MGAGANVKLSAIVIARHALARRASVKAQAFSVAPPALAAINFPRSQVRLNLAGTGLPTRVSRSDQCEAPNASKPFQVHHSSLLQIHTATHDHTTRSPKILTLQHYAIAIKVDFTHTNSATNHRQDGVYGYSSGRDPVAPSPARRLDAGHP